MSLLYWCKQGAWLLISNKCHGFVLKKYLFNDYLNKNILLHPHHWMPNEMLSQFLIWWRILILKNCQIYLISFSLKFFLHQNSSFVQGHNAVNRPVLTTTAGETFTNHRYEQKHSSVLWGIQGFICFASMIYVEGKKSFSFQFISPVIYVHTMCWWCLWDHHTSLCSPSFPHCTTVIW